MTDSPRARQEHLERGLIWSLEGGLQWGDDEPKWHGRLLHGGRQSLLFQHRSHVQIRCAASLPRAHGLSLTGRAPGV
jgi:hypothetical protein